MKKTLAALAAALFIAPCLAQDYPARPVHLVVPYTPGTGADIIARLLGPKLGERWNVAVPTENKPGATGIIGTEHVAKSAADGHTLLVVATSFGIDLAKREPGKMHYSSPGSGGPQHLVMELLKLETGIDLVHVPYKGAAGALRALALKDPSVRAVLEKQGMSPAGGPPQRLEALVKRELPRWARVVQAAGIKAD